MDKPETDIEPESELEQTNPRSRRAKTSTLIAGVSLAATATIVGPEIAHHIAEIPTPGERAARTQAHEAFEGLLPSDIVKCDVTAIASGPMTLYRGKESPSIRVTVDVSPGEKYNEPWFQRHKIGDYEAEILWYNPVLRTTQEVATPEKRINVAFNPAVPVAKFDPREPITDAGGYMNAIDNSRPSTIEMIMPLDNSEKFRGVQSVYVREAVGPLKLVEWQGEKPPEVSHGEHASQTCATLKVDVQQDSATILSAENALGEPLQIR